MYNSWYNSKGIKKIFISIHRLPYMFFRNNNIPSVYT